MNQSIVFRALDGSNPLAFMAALGALRLLSLQRPDARVRMRWFRNGIWRPQLTGLADSEDQICEMLVNAPCAPVADFASLGKNITVPAGMFRVFVKQVADKADPNDRRAADFAAAFGNEICEEKDKDRIEYTDFCFITGSGHQDFIGTIEALNKSVTVEHIRDALFGKWCWNKGLSMRWDPDDAAEYALRWDDPGPKGAWAVWGANRLAVEALPLFPTQPMEHGLETTGFRRRGRVDEFTWPLWTHAITCDTVRSLLALSELQDLRELEQDSPERALLSSRGVAEVYRSRRARIGQGANFKISFRPARAL